MLNPALKTLSLVVLFVLLVSPALAQTTVKKSSRTSTVFSVKSGSGGVDVYPYLSGDKKTLYIDFESANLRNVEYIQYNLNYDTRESGGLRGAESKFVPDPKEFRYFNGKPYIRKTLVTGTCSGKVCRYDNYPHNIRITVTTKLKGVKKEQTKVYNIDY